MSRKVNLAIVGASGVVGESIIEVLKERKFPVEQLTLVGGEKSEGKSYRFQGQSIKAQRIETVDWSQIHIALFAAGSDISAKWAPIAADEGVVVIDNTSCFRYEQDIPLVIPEVNGHMIAEYRNRNIIANPNCSTIQMLIALFPIYRMAGISRINVATYQSVSGAGKAGIDALASQTAKLLNGQSVEPETFSQQIAFNCIPQIDQMMDNGYSKEEMKMVWETQKILNDANIEVNPTCVRVPVFYGHAEAIHLETVQPLDAEQAIQLLSEGEGIQLFTQEMPTQVKDGVGDDLVKVGRIRNDISHANGLNMWVVADNIRKGAATNAVQIAQRLVSDYF